MKRRYGNEKYQREVVIWRHAVTLQRSRALAAECEAPLIAAMNTVDGVALAKGLRISQQYLSDIRRGRRRISDALVARLIDGDSPPPGE